MPQYVSPSRCLTDSQLPGSRSGFMRRTQDNELGFHIDAFRFYQEDGAEVRAVFKKRTDIVEAITATVVKLFYSYIIYRHYVGYCDSASLFCSSCFFYSCTSPATLWQSLSWTMQSLATRHAPSLMAGGISHISLATVTGLWPIHWNNHSILKKMVCSWSMSRSFIHFRWRSADENDLLCGHCLSLSRQKGVDQAPAQRPLSPRLGGSQLEPRIYRNKPPVSGDNWSIGMKAKKGVFDILIPLFCHYLLKTHCRAGTFSNMVEMEIEGRLIESVLTAKVCLMNVLSF